MKLVKIMLVILLGMSVLLVAGCGEEEKYNKAKNEVLAMVQEASRVGVNNNYDPLTKQEAEKVYQKSVEEHNQIEAKIQEKLKEMREYTIKNTALNNDLIALETKVKEEDNTWNRIMNNNIDIKRLHVGYRTIGSVKGAI